MVTVQLLGGACLRSGDAPLAGPPAQRHRVALLALVVASWPHPLPRDRAMALLWPEKDTASARRLLNLALHVLRGALGDDAIVSTGDAVLWTARVPCDLHQLRAAIAAGDSECVVARTTGTLLDGVHLDESAEFGFWLDGQRAELAHAYVSALHAVAERQERAGDVRALVGTSRRLVAADPHAAAPALALMRALDRAGDRAGAIQHAADHARRLRAELELEPDPEVIALAERLRAAPARRATVAIEPETTDPSVAVLPFLDLGGDADGLFADGITEDVIAHLAKVRALKVISRTSVMAFKGPRRPPREVGAALGARTLLDGTVRRAGDRVRIVATLVDAESERQLWAETYDRRLTDIFEIQTDVALRITAALEAELTGDERSRVSRPPTSDLHAYQHMLLGRHWQVRYTPEGHARAVECYAGALARDPTFALAAAHLAVTCTESAEFAAVPSESLHARAAEAVATALRLDPSLGEAHLALAYFKTIFEYDWAGAEQAFRRALELSPGSADAHDLFGRLLMGIGRFDEAIVHLDRARELDPLAHRVDGASALLRAGRVAEATARVQEVLELEPDYDRAHGTMGWACILAGRSDEGIAHLERAAARSGDSTLWLAQLGQAYGMFGRTEEARAILQRLEERARDVYVSPYHLAYVHMGLGDAERVFDLLERAVDTHTGAAYAIKGSFLFAPLRQHPRFRALLERMGLE